jgi:microcompartment protein CcmK/EutM
MFVGKVIGTVWSTVKWPELSGHKLLVVRPYHLDTLRARHGPQAGAQSTQDPPHLPHLEIPETVVCIDLLDAGVGDDVVVAFGHAARVAAQSQDAQNDPSRTPAQKPTTTPIDAAVVAIVDGYSLPDLAPALVTDLANPVALDGTTR